MVDDNEYYPPHLALIRCPPPRHPPPRRPPLAPAMIRCPPPIPAAPNRYPPVSVLIRHPPPIRHSAPAPIRYRPPSSPASFRHPPPRRTPSWRPRESLASCSSHHPPVAVILYSYVPVLQHKYDGFSDCEKLKLPCSSLNAAYIPFNGCVHIKDYIPFTIYCDTYRPVRISLRPLKKSFLGQQLWRRHSFPTFPSDEWQGFWWL